MKKWLFTMLFGSALVLGACGGGGDDGGNEGPADNGGADTEESAGDEGGGSVDTAAAEELYQNNCASCHGGDLSGGSGPKLSAIGSKYSADEIAGILKNGKNGGMPAFEGQLSEGDITTLSSWLAEKK
ncbi:cytochrome c551 [Virgibacillus litoralis]|uniref:Mono/diheme cytochrome c family protein n=1 Tax=Virgibacillus litoralis TaxID=578221 RepID=A0ABS4HAN9_9BACI|nr:cytochrome c [Virgibacillus litoralis]MBP1947967.1 mono/diheme cytochrome c family protein [Virgibacillus litoralis]